MKIHKRYELIDFVVALAYCLENIRKVGSEESKKFAREKRINSVFLPNLSASSIDFRHTPGLAERMCSNVTNSQKFIIEGLGVSIDIFDDVFEEGIERYFSSEVAPIGYSSIRKGLKKIAASLFELDPDLIRTEAQLLIERQLTHRKKVSQKPLEPQKVGFGLVFVSSIE